MEKKTRFLPSVRDAVVGLSLLGAGSLAIDNFRSATASNDTNSLHTNMSIARAVTVTPRPDSPVVPNEPISYSSIVRVRPGQGEQLTQAVVDEAGPVNFSVDLPANQTSPQPFYEVDGYGNLAKYLADKIPDNSGTITNPVGIFIDPGVWNLDKKRPDGECELDQNLYLVPPHIGVWHIQVRGPAGFYVKGECASASLIQPGISLVIGDRILPPALDGYFNNGTHKPIGLNIYKTNLGGEAIINAQGKMDGVDGVKDDARNLIKMEDIAISGKEGTGYGLHSVIYTKGAVMGQHIKISNVLGTVYRYEGGEGGSIVDYEGHDNTASIGSDIRVMPYEAISNAFAIVRAYIENASSDLGGIFIGRAGTNTAINNILDQIRIISSTTFGNGSLYLGSGTNGSVSNIAITQSGDTEAITVRGEDSGDGIFTSGPWDIAFPTIVKNDETLQGIAIWAQHALLNLFGGAIKSSNTIGAGQLGIHSDDPNEQTTVGAQVVHTAMDGPIKKPKSRVNLKEDQFNLPDTQVTIDEDGCTVEPKNTPQNPTWQKMTAWIQGTLANLIKHDERGNKRFDEAKPNDQADFGALNCVDGSATPIPTTTPTPPASPTPTPDSTATLPPSATPTRTPTITATRTPESTPNTQYTIYLVYAAKHGARADNGKEENIEQARIIATRPIATIDANGIHRVSPEDQINGELGSMGLDVNDLSSTDIMLKKSKDMLDLDTNTNIYKYKSPKEEIKFKDRKERKKLMRKAA